MLTKYFETFRIIKEFYAVNAIVYIVSDGNSYIKTKLRHYDIIMCMNVYRRGLDW
jgi:hypothetical protein